MSGRPGPRDVAELLQTVTTLLSGTLGPVLSALYLHGSLVAGDFAPARSDVDLLAVLTQEPDDDLLEVLRDIHREVEARHGSWRGRVEVEYVAVRTLQQFASPGGLRTSATIARVSPGEDLHLLPATRHRILTWSSVRERGRALVGPPAHELVPGFDESSTRAALLEHVRDWPVWVRDMTGVGAQAYAVLTVCRAAVLVEHGRQVSKRSAATLTAAADPEWSDLVLWARDWWYHGGEDDQPVRTDDVQRFVDVVSARLLAAWPHSG